MSAQRGLAGLLAVQSLEPGWDSYDAPVITGAALDAAKRFMAMLRESSPFVVPCSDGGLQLEWHQDGFDVEIEITPEGIVDPWEEVGDTMAPKSPILGC